MRKPVRCIDWSQVVFDLEYRAGMSWSQIAAECGYAQFKHGDTDNGGKSWVQRLKNMPNTQPDFHSGALLIGLWAEKMGKPISDIPRAEYRFVRNALGRIVALPLIDVPASSAAWRVEPMQEEP